MNITIGLDNLSLLVCRQIENLFLLEQDEFKKIKSHLQGTIKSVELCFSQITNKYYFNGQDTLFNPYHSGQYTIFLYFLSRQMWLNGENILADKIYYLNRTLNSVDLFYEIELPKVFFLDHPYSSIMGRARYKDYFVFQQNCTVGNNKGIYPVFGEYVWMFANATVIGNCNIGNNVFISANTYIKDTDIPDNTIVFGESPNLILKEKEPEYFYEKSPFLYHRGLIKG